MKNYLVIKYPEDSKPELVRKSKEGMELDLETINRGLKELYYYQSCNKEKDDECEHWCCVYAVLWLGHECKATCGRRDKQ